MKSDHDKCTDVDGETHFDDSAEKKYNLRLSEEDYNFWRHLARDYSEKLEKKEKEKDINKAQWESIQSISEEIEYEKKVLRQLKGKTSELERMMTLSHVYLENIKHLTAIKFGSTENEFIFSSSTPNKAHHILARQSPYPATRIQRIPVPDKYVPWEVMWIDYDPVAYTKQKYDFDQKMEPHVDEDILYLQQLQSDEVKTKLPVYKWNCSSTSPAGITIDRRSWCVNDDGTNLIYKLDNFIPRNIYGRTGLNGRGALPRWGPNHFVMLIITRWQSSRVPIAGGKVLELVIEKGYPRWDQISLPTTFVPGENLYTDLQNLFKNTTNPWNTSDDMIAFFESCCAPVDIMHQMSNESSVSNVTAVPSQSQDPIKYELVHRGYMDDPFNTDHSWKEVELWHIHLNTADNLSEKMSPISIGWRIITEDVFIKLPSGQAALLQEITNKLQPAII